MKQFSLKNFLKRHLGLGESLSASTGGFWLGYDQDKIYSVDRALSEPIMFACVRVISETVASLSLNVFESIDGKRVKARGHTTYRVLHDSPNDESDSFSFWQAAMTQVLTLGNMYIKIERNNYNQTESIHLLDARQMQVTRDISTNKIIYKYQTNTTLHEYKSQNILHIAGPSFDGVVGYSPIELLNQQIRTSLSQDAFAEQFYKRGSKKDIIVKPNKTLSDAALKNFRSSIDEATISKVFILEDGMDLEFNTMNLTDSQFIENRRFVIEQIARFFRVPLHLVNELSRSTNNNIEKQSIEFQQYCILPWIKRIEKAINQKLFSNKERGRFFAEFDIDSLLRADSKSKNEAFAIQLSNGIKTINEIRAMLNLAPLPSELGDVPMVSQQLRSLDSALNPSEVETKNSVATESGVETKKSKKNKKIKDGAVK